jgi:glycerol-3-phosphate dehydrogenase (NAD(P)+)
MVVKSGGIAVLGAGSWGTALSILLARNGQSTVLWGRNTHHIDQMRATGSNARALPGHAFPATLTVTSDLAAALSSVQDILVVVPSHGFQEILTNARPLLGRDVRVAWGTKGFEPGTGRLLHRVVKELLGETTPTAVISGPTFAQEVVSGLPAAVTVASDNGQFADELAARLHLHDFRVYTSNDLIGVQVGGAIKNVLAIGAGIADGLGFGANTRAALITRGIAELMRLGVALGGQSTTFMGLAGLGDLVLTCTDDQSRNRRLGLALGRGQSLEAAQAALGQVAEGVRATREVLGLARRCSVEMPICTQVDRVLEGLCQPREAVDALLSRELKQEF